MLAGIMEYLLYQTGQRDQAYHIIVGIVEVAPVVANELECMVELEL